jgi:hypothetical protein
MHQIVHYPELHQDARLTKHKIYTGPNVKNPLFVSDFKENLIFSTYTQKNAQISNVTKI